MAEPDRYEGKALTIVNDGPRCIHSRFCVLNLNTVFKPNVEGPWIDPDAADAQTVIAVVEQCPSGALRYEPKGDTAAESPPTVNTVRVWENGPLAFDAALDVAGDASSHRATLCRCGLSKRKPFCDHSHEGHFTATGAPPENRIKELATRDGPLKVTPTPDGPLMVEGNLEVCCATGKTVARDSKMFLCRCGHSADKPFCDGSHKRAGFKDPGGLPRE